ncbi:alcohol dehydrogenase catalytic domain-containing protein [Salinibacterium sp. ZJ454]|uniref:zinc-dependent alcohol dehydrogenase n=1 Tax=Salinibacterium sp. ZJ454 TaxID=2708339 RepID=UPI00141EEA86|nr:alcohol dehydrogenase catalytic domain-containing protein [Salinibacterium sp. ZJ454]
MTESGSMRAAVLSGRGQLTIDEHPLPRLRPDYVRIRVDVAGICGSDVSEFRHGPLLAPLESRHRITGHLGPLVLGHEFSGTVAAVGAEAAGVQIGWSVVSAASASCGHCSACRSGNGNRCPDYWAVGLQQDGGLAEYCDVPAGLCVPYDAAVLTADTAALAQPMAIAVHSMKQANISAGTRVAIVGIGGVGAFLLAAVNHLTDVAHILALDPAPDRRLVARTLGATETAGGDVDHEPDVDVVYEMSGTVAGLESAARLTRPGGTIVLTGLQNPDAVIGALLRDITLREITITGAKACVPADDMPDALAVLASRSDWSSVAPEVFALDRLRGLLDGSDQPDAAGIKLLFDPRARASRPATHGL